MLAYLARYTHRVAIANSRLIALDKRGVIFRYKDYRNGQARYRTMTLTADQFIRRFLLHVLPKGFVASAVYVRIKSNFNVLGVRISRYRMRYPQFYRHLNPARRGSKAEKN